MSEEWHELRCLNFDVNGNRSIPRGTEITSEQEPIYETDRSETETHNANDKPHLTNNPYQQTGGIVIPDTDIETTCTRCEERFTITEFIEGVGYGPMGVSKRIFGYRLSCTRSWLRRRRTVMFQ